MEQLCFAPLGLRMDEQMREIGPVVWESCPDSSVDVDVGVPDEGRNKE